MEAIKTKGTAKDGMLTIQVPEDFEGRDLEVIVLSVNEQANSKADNKKLKAEKIIRLLSIIGTAKDMNKTFDKHDVYDQ